MTQIPFGGAFWRSAFWREQVRPYTRWMASGHGEVHTLALKVTPERLTELLGWTAPCAACGKPMHPVRTRKASSPYIAVSCPPEVNPGCSRGALAEEAFAEIRRLTS